MHLDPLRRPSLCSVGLSALAALAALAPSAALGEGQKPVHVLHLASSGRDSYDALRLTKQLEHRFVASDDARLINSSQSLLELLNKAKCGKPFIEHTLGASPGEGAEHEPDAACLAKVASVLGHASGGPAESYVWGWLGREASGQTYAVLHLWQKGQPDRQARLPYAPDQSAQLADRAYLKLWHPNESGDARVLPFAQASGNLWVDDQDRGPFAPNAELTLRTGEHTFELRQDTKVVGRAKASVATDKPVEVRLEPVAEAPKPAAALSTAAAPVDQPTRPAGRTRRGPGALPFIAFGVGAAALAGGGVFFALRQSKESDLDGACPNGCPPSQQSTIDASNRYGTLSLVLGGVGIAAVGVGVFTLLRSHESPRTNTTAPLRARPGAAADARKSHGGAGLRYDVVPLAGGAAASMSASF